MFVYQYAGQAQVLALYNVQLSGILLVEEPSCSVVTETPDIVEGDVVTLVCNVSYVSSSLSPAVMEWTDSNGQLLNSSERIETDFFESSISFIAGPPTVDRYTCLTYFDVVHDDLPTTAKNIPDYNFTYTSPNLVVVRKCS